MDWTIDDHLRNKPAAAIAMYHRFVELVERCGPFTYAVAKTTITLKGIRRGFAGARPTDRGQLVGYFDLQREARDPRVTSVSPYTARLFVHHFRVNEIDELDDDSARSLARRTRSVLEPTSRGDRNRAARIDPARSKGDREHRTRRT